MALSDEVTALLRHISRQELGRLQTLQPQAIVRFATRVIDLSGTLEKFGIQHS